MIRLQKFLADCGVASRRKAEDYISQGLVKVNQQIVTELGSKIDPEKDVVYFKGKKIESQSYVYLILNKPKDYITTRSDPEQRKTIYDLLPEEYKHLHPMGRLDRHTTGLLLLTNDGDLTQRLSHPSNHISKTYRLEINKKLTEKDFSTLQEGVMLEGRMTLPAKLSFLEDNMAHIEITIWEGRNRQIRKMFETLGYDVIRLKRTKIGPLQLGNLKLGEYRLLRENEVALLKPVIGKAKKAIAASKAGKAPDQRKWGARAGSRAMNRGR